MTDIDEQGRPEPPLAGDETATLLGFLDYQRATLAWKCAGLDAAGLRATVGASSMTLGGMLKHLAHVEDSWFSRGCTGGTGDPVGQRWTGSRPRLGLALGRRGHPRAAPALWQDTVARSAPLVAEALADGGLDRPARRSWPDGRAPSLRWILLPHDRGVRAAQRPRRPAPGVGGRAHRE